MLGEFRQALQRTHGILLISEVAANIVGDATSLRRVPRLHSNILSYPEKIIAESTEYAPPRLITKRRFLHEIVQSNLRIQAIRTHPLRSPPILQLHPPPCPLD